MADDNAPPSGERTEAATPRRLQRAREEGQVPVSRELVTLAGLAAVTGLAMIGSETLLATLAGRLAGLLRHAGSQALAGPEGMRLAAQATLGAAGPVVLAAAIGGAGAVLAQTGFLLHGQALMPRWNRLDPRAGLRRLIGAEGLAEAMRSLAKLLVLGVVLAWVLRAETARLGSTLFEPLPVLLGRLGAAGTRLLLAAVGAQAVIALADVAWVQLRHLRQLRMSRQDIRDEQKETDGDPAVKGRLRQLRLQRARRRMMAAVPKATVVVTNPTHYAVALSYAREANAAPRVVAKGADTVAARIRETARKAGVPMVSNPPLARALFRVELDAEIPAEHYQAVAELIAYVWRLGERPRAVPDGGTAEGAGG